MIKTIEESEESEESSEGGNDRKRIRFDPNVSQIKTNFIPGSAFRHKSQLSSKSDVCVRKRNHSLASSQPSVDEDYDSDATVIDETFAETVDDWRNGPAKYWYDRLGLPADCLEYDYGLKVMDNRESSHTSRPSVDAEDAFNLVSQTEWESEVIWDSDVVAQQVMKRAKELETSAGWLPIGSTRSAPDFVKQIECPIVGGVADDIEDNCGKSVFNANNTNNNCYNFTKIIDKNKDNSKTATNSVTKNLRKRKANVLTNNNSNNNKIETKSLLETKTPALQRKRPKRWVSTLAEENRELIVNVWEDQIIWDTEAMRTKLEPKIVPFNGDDHNVIIALSECTDEDTNDSQMTDLFNQSTDLFNISNDEFYASKVKADNNATHDLIIKHSIPALNLHPMLFPTCPLDIDRPLLKRSKLLRSGVPHDVLFCSNTRIKVNENLSEDANQMAKDLSKYTINTISELTARNGEVVVMEYSEEEPPFLMRVGMGSKIMNYFKTTKEKNSLPLEEYSELRIVSTDSPFIGEIDSGKSQLALENNMFRSPIFRHSCPETDFLIIRTDDNYYVREVNGLYTVGQQLPLMKVPNPKSTVQSGQYYPFIRQFTEMFIQRFFDGRKTVKSLDTELSKAFKNLSRNFIDKTINRFTNRCSDRFQLKSLIPFDIRNRNLLSPENCCAYYTAATAAHNLKQRGFGDRLYLNRDKKSVDPLDELAIAPWNTTEAYIGSINQKKYLTVCEYNEDGSLLFVNQSFKDIRDQMPTFRKCFPMSERSLKLLTLKRAHEWLTNYGLATERVKKLKNVSECGSMIKKLSDKLRAIGVRQGMTKTASAEQHYKIECQKVFDLHTSYYSSNDTYSTDEEEDEDEEEDDSDSEFEDMGRDLEAILLGEKTIDEIEHEREEQIRKDLMKSLKEGKDLKDKKSDTTHKESLKGKVLKICRIYDNNGKRELRTEIVRRREVIEAYVRIRKTKSPEFIKQLNFVGNVSEDGKIGTKSKSKAKCVANTVGASKVPLKPVNGSVLNAVKSVQRVTNGETRGDSCDYTNIDIDDSDDWDLVETTVGAQQPLVKVEGNKLKFAKQVVIEANEIENEEQRRIKEEEEEELRSKTVEYFQNRPTNRCRVDPMVKLKETFDKLIVTVRKSGDLEESVDFFNEPVKVKEVPDYYDVIAQPMDLSLIRRRISEGMYWTRESLLKDIELIYDNSVEYNGAVNEITHSAHKLVQFCRDYLEERKDDLSLYEEMLKNSGIHAVLKHINS